jgi:Flp pilus assembly protein TadG
MKHFFSRTADDGRWVGGQRGSAAVEAALILPVLLLLMTGIFELGFAAYESMQVQSAADAGAQYAARNAWDAAKISAAVTGATAASGIVATPPPSQFCACPTGGTLATVACANLCPNGTTPSRYALVSARMTHSTIMSYPGLPEPLVLAAQSIVRIQ